ncbi:MAG TPA: ROK family protein [Terriglobia bacterium]|nr:ROK family protein [Terriglobia bacterium]
MKRLRSQSASTKAEHDKRVIEATVFRFSPVSRVEIQELTRLHPTTISHRVRELIKERRLVETGRGDNSMGRKQVLLRLNEERAYIVGVGFDDEYVLAGAMNLHPALKSKVQEPTRLTQGRVGFEKQLIACVRKAMREAGVDMKSVLAIGAAGSGLMNSREGTLVFSAPMGIGEIPLREKLEKAFGVPAFVEHLGRAKAFAERVLGAGARARDMIYLEYGKTGIGAGVILDGRLVYGSSCATGEIGHTHMLEGGPACRCGSFGCLEAIVGAAAIAGRIRAAVADGSTSEALTLAEGDPNKISGFTVLEAAGKGDKTCAAIVEHAGNYLGLALANMVNLFNPSVLVLDPRLSLAGPDLMVQISRVIRRQSLRDSSKDLSVRFGKLGIEATLLGLAAIAVERHFQVPLLKPPQFVLETHPTHPKRS